MPPADADGVEPDDNEAERDDRWRLRGAFAWYIVQRDEYE
jgi:hypothetical protein